MFGLDDSNSSLAVSPDGGCSVQTARYTVGANNAVIVPGIYRLAATCGLTVLRQNSTGSSGLRLQTRLPGTRPLRLGSPRDPQGAAMLSPTCLQGPAAGPSAGPSPAPVF